MVATPALKITDLDLWLCALRMAHASWILASDIAQVDWLTRLQQSLRSQVLEFLMLTTSVSYRTKALLEVHKKLQYILYCTLPRICGVHFPPFHCPFSCTDRTYCHSSTWETAQFKTWSCPTEDLNEAIMAILRLFPQKFHYSNNCDYCQWYLPWQ